MNRLGWTMGALLHVVLAGAMGCDGPGERRDAGGSSGRDAGPEARDADPGGDSGLETRDAATSLDAGLVQRDGGAADGGVDAGAPVDAGPDAPAPPIDTDGDGVPAELDCDDGDPAVGSTAELDCTNACGPGARTCSAGRWGACTAPTDCLCATPGETRVVTCGNCGEKAQRCSDSGSWEDASVCLGEGACAPGTVETEVTDYCEERQRLCRTTCEWGTWTTLSPPGECRRGTYDCPSLGCFSRGWGCDEMCVLGPPPDTCRFHCD